ncbi:hypothetical protein PUN28_005959 [Cardiocondyla obscurior]|uniref:Uncharacterized protein n=1 Tax=Cardiocondyla obscurior TaxID=286306 RepID=A0AAW2GBX9_9HYME
MQKFKRDKNVIFNRHSPPRRFASSRAHFLRGDFSQRPLPPFTTSGDPMPDPPSPSYSGLFFILPRASPLGPPGDQ